MPPPFSSRPCDSFYNCGVGHLRNYLREAGHQLGRSLGSGSTRSLPDSEAARASMVARQLERRGITSARVLDAMRRVPRERFVPPALQHEAYVDRALTIDCGQTISQPYIVALMTQALELTGAEKVLEVGTGSGYQTAILAELAACVVTIERHPDLAAKAERTLAELGYRNVTAVIGDGTQGWPPLAPYDAVLVAAAAAHCPPPLLEQLRDGGAVVIPLGSDESQTLKVLRKADGHLHSTDLSTCRFVPFVGASQAS